MSEEINVYTDGGCSGNPGPGGWAFVILKEQSNISYCSGSSEYTTNNIMELTAVIEAIKTCIKLKFSNITLYTDSQYVRNGITSYIFSWKKNGWLTSSKKEVKNKELWKRLDEVSSKITINWCWVKGHTGIEYNEFCDTLVQSEIKKIVK